MNAGSAAEEMLAFQLKAVRIPFERELRFAPPRRWRADFAVGRWDARLLVEVDGGLHVAGGGRHQRAKGFAADIEKQNAMTLCGYRLLRFSPDMIRRGEALALIERALSNNGSSR